jgi:iron complex outermembrane receptor protein
VNAIAANALRGVSLLALLAPLSAMAQTAPAAPAPAAEETASSMTEIVVTARRRDENIQDVPISIAVLTPRALANANVVNASDLALATPGLVSNERFGSDNASFAIRGFTQELRTTPSVGVYFADVVAPRGATPVTSGDGAGPGSFFDLQNVQVLRGPQGTLFGRNTTGGAVLLVPQRPTYNLEGYVEASIGNFDMKRLQGVLNLPMGEKVRARFGVDHQSRQGYFNNVSPVGPKKLSDVDYTAARASFTIDLPADIENYTVLSYTDSKNNGTASQLFACNPAGGSLPSVNKQLCAASLPTGGKFYDVQNSIPNPQSAIKQWQAINTTTWKATDNLTIKNILAFSNLKSTLVSPIVGTDWDIADITTTLFGSPWAAGGSPGTSPNRYIVQMSGIVPGIPTVAQDSLIEELQFQGNAFDNRLIFQGGAYYEHSKPSETQGGQSISALLCDYSTLGADPTQFRCADTNYIVARASGLPQSTANLISRGVVNRAIGSTEFENKALYAQGTFKLIEKLSVTGGIRYTWDESTGVMQSVNYFFNPTGASDGIVTGGRNASTANDLVAPTSIACADTTLTYAGNAANCVVNMHQKSKAPTWLLGVDYHPVEDVLLYGKYSRGYRQGGVNIASVRGGYTYEPEKVDTYEVGAKTSFKGRLPGTLNVSAFYNDFRNQQIQQGLLPAGGVGTTAIVNVGASTIYGVEADANVQLFDGFTLSASYTYLNSNFDEVSDPITASDAGCGGGPSFHGVCILGGTTAALKGFPTTFSPEHQFAATATYRLPAPESMGKVEVSATYSYSSDYLALMPYNKDPSLAGATFNPYAKIPSFELVNLNLNWTGIVGSKVDGALFVTNLLREKYYTYVAGQYSSTGFDYRSLGRPLTVGARLRYSF